MPKNFVKAETLSVRNANTLDGTFKPINTQVPTRPLLKPCFKIIIVNDSNVDVIVSYDAVNAHDLVASDSSRILDFQTNASPSGWIAQMRAGTIVSIASVTAAPGVGFVYLVGYYQES